MADIKELFDNNKRWADSVVSKEPKFFEELAKGQSPPPTCGSDAPIAVSPPRRS